ncbi:hypothetical protein T459_16701 [Capsicum annuum]|uniref:Bifunctional inhibitor/plant lipid transfer protein/seed storage helical domain-containing protein n=1 Tax=Capsicum annuum TaxID=4072 RepID=A0A2G2Z9K7_CAPAN|nr:putative non-specific lipid-transfer protein-like protein-like isoform 1 [Capsicum annuum]PHT78649.1 hypothetical protein T459_16701 [Capsicum annuum]
MADHRYEMSLAVIVFAVIWTGAIAQESNDCTNVLITMFPCLNYITDSSVLQISGCCTQLSTVVNEKPECLCQVLNGDNSDLGLNINPSEASALTTACKVQTPSASRCNSKKKNIHSPHNKNLQIEFFRVDNPTPQRTVGSTIGFSSGTPKFLCTSCTSFLKIFHF